MYKDITGIILAGGKSKRMGLNKSFLKVGEVTMIERTTELMKSLFERVILITNTPDEYKFLGIEMFEDIYKNVGPLAGIHSGLSHALMTCSFQPGFSCQTRSLVLWPPANRSGFRSPYSSPMLLSRMSRGRFSSTRTLLKIN